MEALNTVKFEHLNEGVNPIVTCVGTLDDFRGDQKMIEFRKANEEGKIHNIDFYASPEDLGAKDFRNAGLSSYVISTIDDIDKFSKKYADCTGIVVTGIEKNSDKNVSFMSHQNPGKFLTKKHDEFCSDLEKQLQEISDRCVQGTIDAVVYGGRYAYATLGSRDYDDTSDGEIFMKEYEESVKLLSDKVRQKLGFEPVVVGGPKTNPAVDDVFFDNKNRRLYLLRQMMRPNRDGPDFANSFPANDLHGEKNKWRPGKWSIPI